MPAQTIQMMVFTQIMDNWRPGRSLEDHLKSIIIKYVTESRSILNILGWKLIKTNQICFIFANFPKCTAVRHVRQVIKTLKNKHHFKFPDRHLLAGPLQVDACQGTNFLSCKETIKSLKILFDNVPLLNFAFYFLT